MSEHSPREPEAAVTAPSSPARGASTGLALLAGLVAGGAMTVLWWAQPAVMGQRWEILAWAVGLAVGFAALTFAGRGRSMLGVGAGVITLMLVGAGHVAIAADAHADRQERIDRRVGGLLVNPPELVNALLDHIDEAPELAPTLADQLAQVEPIPADDEEAAPPADVGRPLHELMESPQWQRYIEQRNRTVAQYLAGLGDDERHQLAAELAQREHPPQAFTERLGQRLTLQNALWLMLALATAVLFACGAVDAAWGHRVEQGASGDA